MKFKESIDSNTEIECDCVEVECDYAGIYYVLDQDCYVLTYHRVETADKEKNNIDLGRSK